MNKKFNFQPRKYVAPSQDDQGIALVLALLMAAVLLGGISALMMRMIGSRKLSTAESYQQMAEAAAVNGFNRILATLNNPNPEDYLGFLYQISNLKKDNYQWGQTLRISEPCAANRQSIPDWDSSMMPLQRPGETARNDSSGALTTHFRLKNYQGPESKSSAQFEIEGIVKREGSNNNYEARSLLRRSLFVNSAIPTADDWAVLTGRHLDLGSMKILKGNRDTSVRNGRPEGGMILKLLASLDPFLDPDSCSATNLLATTNASSFNQPDLANHIWPVANIGNNKWDIPSTTRFTGDGTTDEGNYDTGVTRIWSFDDTRRGPIEKQEYGISCGNNGIYSIACARPTSNQADSQHSNPLSAQIQHLNATTPEKILEEREVRLCVNKKDWWHLLPWSVKKAGETYEDESKCDSSDYKWKSRVEWNTNTTEQLVEFYPRISSKIAIKASDLCGKDTQEDANACHVYIEHLNLDRTSLFIENNIDRPIVLNLGTPDGAPIRSDLNQRFLLENNSLVCGIDNIELSMIDNLGIKDCNNRPELLVIASEKGSSSDTCESIGNQAETLEFGGNNLPASWISWPKGRVQLNASTTTKAVIWANSICTNNIKSLIGNSEDEDDVPSNFTLNLDTTTADNETPIVTATEEQWGWDQEKRYGRTVLRGIRGTGFDTFSRW